MTDWADGMREAAEAKQKLGIGKTLEERIQKLIANQYQYATAGDVKALIEAIPAAHKRGMLDALESVNKGWLSDKCRFGAMDTIRARIAELEAE